MALSMFSINDEREKIQKNDEHSLFQTLLAWHYIGLDSLMSESPT